MDDSQTEMVKMLPKGCWRSEISISVAYELLLELMDYQEDIKWVLLGEWRGLALQANVCVDSGDRKAMRIVRLFRDKGYQPPMEVSYYLPHSRELVRMTALERG